MSEFQPVRTIKDLNTIGSQHIGNDTMARLLTRIEPNGSLSIMVDNDVVLSGLPRNTEIALSHELALHAGSDCPCHRGQRFVDRLNRWEVMG